MCGIFGYHGEKEAFKLVVDGLTRLEYRGYDSWGISSLKNNMISTIKNVGSIGAASEINNQKDVHIAIGHTRWATHGGVSQENAHPHPSTDGSFVLAQNGIFENFLEVKKGLIEKGYKFKSETDTEVIVRLIEEIQKTDKLELKDSITQAFKRLEGRNTIIVLDKEGNIYAVKNGSPLVLGTNESGEYFLSSDALSFSDLVDKIAVIENFQLIEIGNSLPQLFDIKTGEELSLQFQNLEISGGEIGKGEYENYMLKEIMEQGSTIKKAVQLLDEEMLEKLQKSIQSGAKIYTIGSGTAGVAASIGAYYLRKIAKINAVSLIGAEAIEYYDLFKSGDLIIVPSQSGETADVLEALEIAKKKGVQIASFVNMPGSTISRMSDFAFMANAGPEIAVASTKIFTSQAIWFYLIANFLNGDLEKAKSDALLASEELEKWFKSGVLGEIEELANKIKDIEDLYLFGKSEYYQIAREGMIKLIEVANIHAHALPSGDLKHYVIAMITKGVHAVALVPEGSLRNDVLNAVEQIKTRNGTIIGISPTPHSEFDYYIQIPNCEDLTAVLAVVPLQLLTYFLTLQKGLPIDKPRNIAKSVTVK